MRLAILGNAGSGKSTLSKKISDATSVPSYEIDALLWRPGWIAAPESAYEESHLRIVEKEEWIIDGLGRRESLSLRLDRATHIILCDFPLWQHFWLSAERQLAWAAGSLESKPGGLDNMPPTEKLFETIAWVETEWMPNIRNLVNNAERLGKIVHRIKSFEALKSFQWPK